MSIENTYIKFIDILSKINSKTTVQEIINMMEDFLKFLYELKEIEEKNKEKDIVEI